MANNGECAPTGQGKHVQARQMARQRLQRFDGDLAGLAAGAHEQLRHLIRAPVGIDQRQDLFELGSSVEGTDDSRHRVNLMPFSE
jgi:hypothetical protein